MWVASLESDSMKQEGGGRKMSWEGGKAHHEGALSGSEKCAEPPGTALLKEGGKSIYPQLLAPPPQWRAALSGAGCSGLPAPVLPFRGLSWLLQLQWVAEVERVKCGDAPERSCPRRSPPPQLD